LSRGAFLRSECSAIYLNGFVGSAETRRKHVERLAEKVCPINREVGGELRRSQFCLIQKTGSSAVGFDPFELQEYQELFTIDNGIVV
jgi:hypothetical protein